MFGTHDEWPKVLTNYSIYEDICAAYSKQKINKKFKIKQLIKTNILDFKID